MNGSENGFGQEFGREAFVTMERANDIVNSANWAFGLAILLWRVRTGKSNYNSIWLKISKNKIVIEFTDVVTLKCLNIGFELIIDIHGYFFLQKIV